MSRLHKYFFIGSKYISGFTVSLIFILPSLVWAAFDRSLWKGDPAGYALHSVSVYSNLITNLSQWKGSIFNFYKGPMIFWIGEFFVPLGKLIGSINFSLLLIPLIASYITLVLLFKTFESLFKNKAVAICGSLVVAASPLFNGLSTGFWIEPMQVAIVSWFIYALTKAKSWDFYFSVSQSIIAVSIAMLIKASSPLYIIGPAIAFWIVVFRSNPSMRMNKKSLFFLLTSSLFFLPAAVFYFHNFQDILGFANYAATSPLFFGAGTSKVDLWSDIMSNGIFLNVSYPFAIILFIWGAVKIIKLKAYSSFEIVFIVALFQITIFFIAWVKSPNDDSRYFVPVLPYCAVLVCWGLSGIGNRIVTAISICLFLIQLVVINGFSFGLVQLNPSCGMVHPLMRKPERDLRMIQDIIPLATRDSAIIFDMFPAFGPVEFEYELAKQDLKSNWANCCVDINQFFNIRRQEIDMAKINTDTVWKHILAYNPDFYITCKSRLSSDSAVVEKQRIDKYNGISITVRWAIAERIKNCNLYEPVSFPSYPELLVYKRRDIPIENLRKIHMGRMTSFQITGNASSAAF